MNGLDLYKASANGVNWKVFRKAMGKLSLPSDTCHVHSETASSHSRLAPAVAPWTRPVAEIFLTLYLFICAVFSAWSPFPFPGSFPSPRSQLFQDFFQFLKSLRDTYHFHGKHLWPCCLSSLKAPLSPLSDEFKAPLSLLSAIRWVQGPVISAIWWIQGPVISAIPVSSRPRYLHYPSHLLVPLHVCVSTFINYSLNYKFQNARCWAHSVPYLHPQYPAL